MKKRGEISSKEAPKLLLGSVRKGLRERSKK